MRNQNRMFFLKINTSQFKKNSIIGRKTQPLHNKSLNGCDIWISFALINRGRSKCKEKQQKLSKNKNAEVSS